jgi:hypothetical protein
LDTTGFCAAYRDRHTQLAEQPELLAVEHPAGERRRAIQ